VSAAVASRETARDPAQLAASDNSFNFRICFLSPSKRGATQRCHVWLDAALGPNQPCSGDP